MNVKIEGYVGSFGAKMVKAGESKQITGKLHTIDPDPDLLSQLCDLQPQAHKAMAAALDAGAKVEIPCMGEEMSVSMNSVAGGDGKVTSSHVTLKKIVYNATGVDPVADLHYLEPALKALVLFYYENLGFGIEMNISQAQPDLEM